MPFNYFLINTTTGQITGTDSKSTAMNSVSMECDVIAIRESAHWFLCDGKMTVRMIQQEPSQ